ncbi:translocator protein [Leptinotarsa decemlineata]|uniref:translocator protein n=1 Tax=Leptinotarsa decemlineata TaxID=7539 RepID=UPI000C255A9F|nr:translocator protein-like [Leptinotarsa decemlineata]
MSTYLAALVLTVLPNIGGILVSYSVRNEIKSYYQKLKRPSWAPPTWLFGPVWTVLYILIGFASYLVLTADPSNIDLWLIPFVIYIFNLLLNWLWTPIFFSLKDMRGALHEILIVDITAVLVAIQFYRVNQFAGYLIIPYIVWLSIATALNNSILELNSKEEKEKK